jgi:hypothetical protein
MKKYLFFFAAFLCAVSLWAQSPGAGRERSRQREPVSVSGTLVLADGFIALKSGDTLYYTSGLERLVGFVDGLKENAQVRLEGYDFSRVNPRAQDQTETRHFLRITKLEINGRSYEIGHMAGKGPGRAGRGFWQMGGGPDFRRGGPGFGRSGRHRNRPGRQND